MPGCGTFSHFDVGSFILFPSFSLRVDNSVDNLVSYRSIGRLSSPRIDYAEPRRTRTSARPSHVIPDDSATVASTVVPDNSATVASTPAVPDAPQSPSSSLGHTVTPSASINIPDTTPLLTDRLLHKLHDDLANLLPVPPNATSAP